MNNYKLKRKALSDLGVNCKYALGVYSLNRGVTRINIDRFIDKVDSYINSFDDCLDDMLNDKSFKKYTLFRGIDNKLLLSIDYRRMNNHLVNNEKNKELLKQRLCVILLILKEIEI